MFKWLIPLLLLPSLALAQTCPTRPPGTTGNACASVDFVGAAVAGVTISLPSNQILLGNGGVATAVPLTQDCSIVFSGGNGVITCTKTNNVSFATSATTDTTNAANISSGTLASGRFAANTIARNINTQASANTMVGNWTAGSASLSDNAMPSCADAGGNHLNYVNGTGVTCGNTSGAPTVSAPTVQRCGSGLTCDGSSHTYTPTGGMVRVKVRMCGGGGGGGAQITNAGANGTDTSFNAGGWTAIHGNGGGVNNTAGGNGGTGGANGTGTLVNRTDGQNGAAGYDTGGAATGGIGGSTWFGGGGTGPALGTTGSNAKANTGSGGQGGGTGAGNAAGAGGGAGECAEFWMTAAQVGASTTYTSGNGGTGGAAGGVAGGNGAQGPIIIEEFYIFLLHRDFPGVPANDNTLAFLNLVA